MIKYFCLPQNIFVLIYSVSIFLISVISLPTEANAEVSPPATLQGVWKGTLGKQQITACFHVIDSYNTKGFRGRYYYNKYGRFIFLGIDDEKSHVEKKLVLGESDGSWNSISTNMDTLTGTWTNSDKHKQYPINLARVLPISNNEEPCLSGEFNNGREENSRIVAAKEKTLNGVEYRMLTVKANKSIGSFELIGKDNATTIINDQLREELMDSILDSQQTVDNSSVAIDYSSSEVPIFLSEHWVSAHSSSLYSNGGPDSIDESDRTWDRRTGKRVDIPLWFNKGGRKVVIHPAVKLFATQNPTQEEFRIAHKLYTEIAQHWDDTQNDGDCWDVGEQAYKDAESKDKPSDAYVPGGDSNDSGDFSNWNIYISYDGLVFTQKPTRMGNCSAKAVVPYVKLNSMLNEIGKDAVASIQADLTKLPPQNKRIDTNH